MADQRTDTTSAAIDRDARTVSGSRVIAADAQALFDIVADPSLHHVIDGSGTVRGSRTGTRKLAMGDRFTTSMRLGVPYLISNHVVEYDEPRLLAWSHIGGWRWRWRFEPTEGGTRVTEIFDWSTTRGGALGLRYIDAMGWPDKHVRNIDRTLERLDDFVTNRSHAL